MQHSVEIEVLPNLGQSERLLESLASARLGFVATSSTVDIDRCPLESEEPQQFELHSLEQPASVLPHPFQVQLQLSPSTPVHPLLAEDPPLGV